MDMRTFIATLVLGASALVATRAFATDPACIHQAQQDLLGCKSGCKSDLTAAKADCKHIEVGCLSQCNADRDDCLQTAMQPLTDCITNDGCAAIVDDGRATCKTQVGCGAPADPCGFNAAFVQCLDPYEQLAFTCRDNCRNLWQLNGGPGAVAACRAQHDTCVSGCPKTQ
jgi:hypothetical protein